MIVRPDSVLVQVRARWGLPAADLLGQITAAVTPVAGGRRVEVVVGDIDDPPAPVLPRPGRSGPCFPVRARGRAAPA